MTTSQRLRIVTATLDDLKGLNIYPISVGHLTDMMDQIVICTASSTTHAQSLCKHLIKELKSKKISILGIESDSNSSWILIDIGDVIVHVMLEQTRDLYALEKLWDVKHND